MPFGSCRVSAITGLFDNYWSFKSHFNAGFRLFRAYHTFSDVHVLWRCFFTPLMVHALSLQMLISAMTIDQAPLFPRLLLIFLKVVVFAVTGVIHEAASSYASMIRVLIWPN